MAGRETKRHPMMIGGQIPEMTGEMMPTPRTHQLLVSTLAIMLVGSILGSPLISPVISILVQPYYIGECEECHGGFVPFIIIPDTPSVVPDGKEFDYRIIIENPWSHEIRDVQVTLDISGSPFLFDPQAVSTNPILDVVEGSIDAGSTATGDLDIVQGSNEILLQLLFTTPFVFMGDANLRLTGPGGGSWVSDLDDSTEVIRVGEDEIREEGYGEYIWTITNEAPVRAIDFHLSTSIDRSGSGILISNLDGIGSGGEAEVIFHLGTGGKGENIVSYTVIGEVYHEHGSDHPDDDVYTVDGTSSIEVGDEYVYSAPGRSITPSTALWYAGRVMAFLTTLFFILSFLTGGSIIRVRRWLDAHLKRRMKLHCTISFLTVKLALVHLLVLYLGLYSGTYKGLYSGGLTLLLMISLGLTGLFKKRIVARTGEKRWRRVHFWLSIVILVMILIHALMEGTDLAFLRSW